MIIKKSPQSVDALENLGRERLSPSFFMRGFLYSEVANHYGLRNVPYDPALALHAGRQLCTELLEPLQQAFGRITIRSGYRSSAVNQRCNEGKHGCAANTANYAFCGMEALPSFSCFDVMKAPTIEDDMARLRTHLAEFVGVPA